VNAVASLPSTFSPGIGIADELAASWLAEATFRLRREICWLWHQRGEPASVASHPLPPVLDATTDSLDITRFADDKRRFLATDVTARYLGRLIEATRESRGDADGPWAAVRHRLALDDTAQFVLALALLARIDPASAAVIATCQGEVGKSRPTLALAHRLCDNPDDLLLIDGAHPLFFTGILASQGDGDSLGWHEGFEVTSLVANNFVRDDRKLPVGLRRVPDERVVATVSTTLAAAVDLLIASPRFLQFVPVAGDAGTDFREWTAMLSAESGRMLVELTQPTLPARSRLKAILAWCWLHDVDLLLPFMAVAADEHARDKTDWPQIPVRCFVPIHEAQAARQFPAHALAPVIALPATDFAMRCTRLRRALGVHAERLDGEIMEAARCFRLGAGAIEAIGRAAADMDTVDGERLHALCRSQVRMDLGALAQPVIPRFELDELILPPAQAQQLQEIVRAMEALTWVHYRWGTARVWNDAGLSVLLCGPPGTGKTMAAEAIAARLRLPMFRIDLSQVVNKYIGETEKNLRKVFDAAEESDCVIFFDEADALFGKRTSVKDAHDRFANIEVSYLLERMERLKGIAILATNRRKDLDEAFLRRLRFLVEFPLPGQDERHQLWRAAFPRAVDTSELDFTYLARTFPLAGGHIRSIAFNACLQTGHGSEPRVEMSQVLAATKRELDKLNRPNSPESFGQFQDQVLDLFEEGLR
jgi:hypothetical protein